MLTERWALLESIHENLKSYTDLPPAVFSLIAERLEDAISATSRQPLAMLSEQLIELFYQLLSTAPTEAAAAVRGTAAAEPSAQAAYLLGKLSFAQLLASQTYQRRADDNFMVIMRDQRYKNYLQALFQKGCTGVELAAISGECAETVSRKLKILRELGITDFRREGTRLVNFLTPVARTVLHENTEFESFRGVEVAESRSPFVSKLLAGLEPQYQRSATFVISANHADYGQNKAVAHQ